MIATGTIELVVALVCLVGACGQRSPASEARANDAAPDATAMIDATSGLAPDVVPDAPAAKPRLTEDGIEGLSANTITLREPGTRTVHGLQVGDPLAAVLRLENRRCETVRSVLASGGGGIQNAAVVRCWVGTWPPRFRYVTVLEMPLSVALGISAPEEVPDDGAELERWIAASGRKIDLILWHRNPAPSLVRTRERRQRLLP